MASLQTLRDKGGVIVAVLIGIALLIFVLTDLLSSGGKIFSRSDSYVGEISGENISIEQYELQVERLKNINAILARFSNQQEPSGAEYEAQVRNQVWESLVRDYALVPSLSKIGIEVGDKEQESFVGDNPSRILLSFFGDESGNINMEALKGFVSSIDKDNTGQSGLLWGYIQQEMVNDARLRKFQALVNQSVYVTALEATSSADLKNRSVDVRFVGQSISSIADSTIVVTDKQVKEFYDANPGYFRTQDTRNIKYALFEAVPSDADYKAAQEYSDKIFADFVKSEDPMQFATSNSNGAVESRFLTSQQIGTTFGQEVQTFVAEAPIGSSYGPILKGNTYTMARIVANKNLPDSVSLSHIILPINDTKQADSILNVIKKGGAKFEEMVAQYSQDPQTKEAGGKIPTLDPQTLPDELREPILKATKGEVFMVENTKGRVIHIFRLNEIIGVSEKIQVASINVPVEPSEATRGKFFDQATAFVALAKKEGFDKAVSAQGAFPRTVSVMPNDRGITGVDDSRQVVRWAYNAKQKDVSEVLEFGDKFVVATVNGIVPKGVAPFDQVKEDATTLLKNRLKGEQLMKKLGTATSLDQLSSELNSPIVDASQVTTETVMVPQMGYDPAFGAIVSAKGIGLKKPFIGVTGVYRAEIVSEVPAEVTVSPEMERELIKSQTQQYAMQYVYRSVLDLSDIVDSRYRVN